MIEHLTSRLLAIYDPELLAKLHTDTSSIGNSLFLLKKYDHQPREMYHK